LSYYFEKKKGIGSPGSKKKAMRGRQKRWPSAKHVFSPE
jgi:hypothetical protein